ncbi:hypothetical protein ABBQ32_012911 [Trebouxia sp. C0010 RCD-2024]
MALMQRLANKRGKFGAAWLDYISLHDIDFKDSLSCVCKGKLGVLPELVQMASCLAAKPSCPGCRHPGLQQTPQS